MPLRDYEDEIITPEMATQSEKYMQRQRLNGLFGKVVKVLSFLLFAIIVLVIGGIALLFVLT